MADTRRSTELRTNKSIRSLSAPAFQVRNNRTCFLRKIFAVNNDDLSYLARPPMGETNQTVAGQNKSAAKMSQKQVNLWFKERRYLMDKLDKAEDDVYQRLLSIHKTKIMIEKAREASPDRSSIALYSRRTSRATNYRPEDEPKKTALSTFATPMNENVDNIDTVPQEGEQTEGKAETTEGKTKTTEAKDKTEGANEDKAKEDKPKDEKQKNTDKNEKLKLNIDDLKVVPSPREIKAQESVRSTGRPNTQANVSARGQNAPPVTDRAKTELGLINENPVPPVTPKAPEPEIKPRPKQQLRVTEPVKYVPPKKSKEEPKTNARRIEERILNEPFTYWMQDQHGKLIPSDVPYKRREFPLPDERDDEGRKRDFLEYERKSKHDNMKRFSSLCDDLQKLEEWNPLDEIRAMAELRRKQEKDEAEAEDRWKKLGMLRHWVRAFGMREAQELEGLDPNSAEALEKCKYLRRKEKTNDSMEKKKSSRKKDKRSKSKDTEGIKNKASRTSKDLSGSRERPDILKLHGHP